ncbi:hypothetical protein AVEN_165566-1 [Araneus ventricosus]|uniref:Uncharacterized protein n=1 Tax=Araneus ventricosus TaxID=182803 RepID=A0A4Y2N463_ARAVE|nr:hypothetical protein AVEN_165566-1 [Araneus ventricosus]
MYKLQQWGKRHLKCFKGTGIGHCFEVENWSIPHFQPARTIGVRRISRSTCKETSGGHLPPHIPRISGVIFHDLSLKVVHLAGRVEPPEGMQKEVYEKWMSIGEDIPIVATLTDLETFQAVCKQDQAIKVNDSDGDECVEENPRTNAEMW